MITLTVLVPTSIAPERIVRIRPGIKEQSSIDYVSPSGELVTAWVPMYADALQALVDSEMAAAVERERFQDDACMACAESSW